MHSRTFISTAAGLMILVLISNIAGAVSPNDTTLVPSINTSSGPDYSITNIVLSNQTSWINTGTTLNPTITIRNLGPDDIRTESIEITAHLGAHTLIPQHNLISPMKRGEERQVTPGFLIPVTIQSGEYSLILSIDQGKNQATADRPLTIRTTVPKIKVSSCGCS